jgi:hypothetical protein
MFLWKSLLGLWIAILVLAALLTGAGLAGWVKL